MHYTFTDHQGSLAAYTGNAKEPVTRLSYDAWGRRRNAEDGSYGNVPAQATDRGYTGHEHLDEFGLINMNGRMYDPMLGRMLSPDIVVQQTDYTQSYNRYSYCFNNPLRFTDPTGWVVNNYWDPFGKYGPESIKINFDEKGNLLRNNQFNTSASEGNEHIRNVCIFGQGDPDASEVRYSTTGPCVESVLGQICYNLGGEYQKDDAVVWHTKMLEYNKMNYNKYEKEIKSGKMKKESVQGNSPGFIEDYIEWTNGGKYQSYQAEQFGLVTDIPSAYQEQYQIMIAVDYGLNNGHAGIVNRYEEYYKIMQIRLYIGDPSPVRIFEKSYFLKPIGKSRPYYYKPPFNGNSTFYKIKGL